jgi:hypothetical protein
MWLYRCRRYVFVALFNSLGELLLFTLMLFHFCKLKLRCFVSISLLQAQFLCCIIFIKLFSYNPALFLCLYCRISRNC